MSAADIIKKVRGGHNCGNCGILSFLVIRELEKHRVPFELYLADPKLIIAGRRHILDQFDISSKEGIRLYPRGLLTAVHVFLYLPDSECFFNFEGDLMNMHDSIISISSTEDKELLNLYLMSLEKSIRKRKYRVWNPLYDRRQNSKLQKAVKYYFNKLSNGGGIIIPQTSD
nr:MAG TPA: hypothetical protein [Caudoviricetes sp.]